MHSHNIRFANLEIEITQQNDDVYYTFKGDIDEHFKHEEVPRISDKENIIFNLKEINNFNSCGIREWIYFIKDISKLGFLRFKECSVTMIDQVNMVPDTLGSGIIDSFYAPYYCEEHGEINKLIKVTEFQKFLSANHAPEFKCDKCDRRLEFDAIEESYFLFSKSFIENAS